jgi:outer membrane protein assembly factor BamB
MRYALPLLVAFFCAAASTGNDNWPQFRGPTGDGISDSKNVPTTWSETENIRWKTAIHDRGWSSPVVWGDQIWLTTAHTEGKSPRISRADLFAVCLDRRTGAIVHDLKLLSVEQPAFCHPYNSYASPTPVVEEARVYAHFGSHGTFCVDTASGKVLWERRDLPCDHFRGPGSSPILSGRLLILTFDGVDLQYLTALDKESGKTVWKTDRTIEFPKDVNKDLKKAYSTPSILYLGGQKQLISPAAEATIAYNPDSGRELWRIVHGGMNQAPKPVFGHQLIFLTSGHTGNLLAVHQGGKGKLTKDAIEWKINRAVPTRPSLLLTDNLIFMVSDKAIASCLEAKTGKQCWQERLDSRDEFTASPVYAAGNIYFTDESESQGKTHVVAARPTFELRAVNKLDSGCMASPAIAGEELFLRTRTHLYCISHHR